MKFMWAAVFGVIAVGAPGTVSAEPTADAREQYRVSAIRPRFFLHESGVLETEEASQAGGWNMPFKAEAVLIMIDLVGPGFPLGKGSSLEFTATSGKARLLHRWQSLEQTYVSDSGHVTLPFLVYGVGCEPMKLSATLLAKGKRNTKTAVVPLACGE